MKTQNGHTDRLHSPYLVVRIDKQHWFGFCNRMTKAKIPAISPEDCEKSHLQRDKLIEPLLKVFCPDVVIICESPRKTRAFFKKFYPEIQVKAFLNLKTIVKVGLRLEPLKAQYPDIMNHLDSDFTYFSQAVVDGIDVPINDGLMKKARMLFRVETQRIVDAHCC